MNVSDPILDQVHARLSQPGVWVRGGKLTDITCDCLATAVDRVINRAHRALSEPLVRDRAYHETMSRLIRAIDPTETSPHVTHVIWFWNDAPGRTLDEVLAMVLKAKTIPVLTPA
jgi:hypothetical protein